ncbi:hypothetical protein BFP97_13585 [Roseivirga sp. 4D4]|uniref:glycosyltransferase family 4 protein n=1 Tax=Roseivirga sp. 4D4 TaxID=1889784 RepID=UPI0008534FC6|nr:glycosyltransferase family 4 protein [Roseivirga sp. 4D4]OEK02489.1 hypothetical protein BFP97_13585 [Roseivirga sp. 4D4]
MRITVVTSEFYPMSLAAAVRMAPWVDALIDAGHDVKIITTKASKGVEKYKVACTFFQGPKNSQGFAVRLLAEILFGIEIGIRSFFRKSDAYIVTSPPFFMGLIAITLIRLKGKPYVLDIRDDYPRIFKEQGLIKETNPIYRFIDGRTTASYKKAAIVTGATQGLVDNIIQKVGTAEKVVLLRNGYVIPEGFLWPAKRKKFTAVFHGNLGKFQNIELLLAVAERLKEHEGIAFLIIGSGAQEKLVNQCELPNVSYLGRIPHDQIMVTIASCHVGLSFRIDGRISQDAFPVKVYEYIGVGIPSVITPVSEASEFVKKYSIGIEFRNLDVNEISNTVLRMASDEKYYRSFTNEIANLKNDFQRDNQCREFVNLFESKLVR